MKNTKETLNPTVPYTVTIDDDPMVSKIIEAALGTRTLSFSATRDVLDRAEPLTPQAIFVDVHLDQENGLAALPRIREQYRYCPIIVITGDTNDTAIAEALTLGADDFIMKPLRPREVVARLQARLADQALKQGSQSLVYGDVQLDQIHRVLRGPKGERFLSPTELNLLVALMRSAGTTLERSMLKNQCWDHIAVSDNALDRKVFEVRRALADVGGGCSIGTAYGVGFYLEPGAESPSMGAGQ
jgi:two-component system response regulator protein BraR/BceR